MAFTVSVYLENLNFLLHEDQTQKCQIFSRFKLTLTPVNIKMLILRIVFDKSWREFAEENSSSISNSSREAFVLIWFKNYYPEIPYNQIKRSQIDKYSEHLFKGLTVNSLIRVSLMQATGKCKFLTLRVVGVKVARYSPSSFACTVLLLFSLVNTDWISSENFAEKFSIETFQMALRSEV